MCSSLSYCSRVDLCDQENVAEVMAPNFQDKVIKDSIASEAVFLSDHKLLGKANCHVIRAFYGETHMARHGGLLINTTRVSSEVDPPVQVKPSEDYSPSETLSRNHTGNLLWNSWSREAMS